MIIYSNIRIRNDIILRLFQRKFWFMCHFNLVPRMALRKKTVISPNFLVWKFYGKAQSRPKLWGSLPFHKISTPGY